MLMLRPSLSIAWIGATPSAVAGIFTIRLRRAIVLWRWRAAVSVPDASWASDGATSTLTKPSPPSLDSYTGSRTSQAPLMSFVTSAQ